MNVLFMGLQTKNYVIDNEIENFENEENSEIDGEVDLKELLTFCIKLNEDTQKEELIFERKTRIYL